MKSSRKNFLYIVLLILLCVIVILTRSFFYNYLVDPMTRILWLVVRMFRAIDQEVIWTLLIFIVFITGLLIFPSSKEDNVRSAYSNAYKIEDRFAFWESQFWSADADAANRLSLKKNLEELYRAIDELVDGNEKIEINLPMQKTKPWQFILRKVKKWVERVLLKRAKFQDKELESNITQILDAMESMMETENDQSPSSPKNR